MEMKESSDERLILVKETPMKKLMTLMLGMTMLLGASALFAADTPADTAKKPAATAKTTKIKKHKTKKVDPAASVKPAAATK
jgi:hypothetical protein